MTDLQRLNHIQDLVITQQHTIDATLLLIEEWLIKLETKERLEEEA